MGRNNRKNWINQFIPWLIPIFVVIGWQVLTGDGVISSKILPQPLKIVDTFIKMIKTGELIGYVITSTQRALSGFIIGGGIGLLLGLLNGLSPSAEKLIDSSVQMIRNIPHLALIPLLILWFGIGEEVKLVLVSLGVFFPIYLNTFHGIRSIDPGLIEMGKVYGLKGFSLFWEIILPGSLASILVGVRYALGIMWLTLIVAETVAANSGIGYMAMNAREFMLMDVIILSIIIYALLGKSSDIIAKKMEQRWLEWRNIKNSGW
ncbi:ABC transporter permease subunit [Pelosinus sp. UFO1]|uniref:ABC transporter permease subunit n=1 Tax=Pelosinus sp. UFO1 TaxID=484770 RepID=UPI0004D0F439|nr:ABC transporter permease subunit [Pelosinus sp. UFO1]AIF52362.1 ABC-type transporter, integral membrane subunit [Pelosinus sp. UFO1]